MNNTKLLSLCTFLLMLCDGFSGNPVRFFENKGQFKCSESYMCEAGRSNIYFGHQRITYNVFDTHTCPDHQKEAKDRKAHCIQIEFAGCNTSALLTPFSERTEKYNYFFGNNPAAWKTDVKLYNGLLYQNIYTAIDFKYYCLNDQLKYDVIVKPGANPSDIALLYRGQHSLRLIDGHLQIGTSVGYITEEKPYAYQLDTNGNKKEITCRYVLKGSRLGFEFPEGYDKTKAVVIDPTIVFSTYSSTSALLSSDGATYDSQGNLYVAAGTLGNVYQGTPGAYTTGLASGNGWDIVIEKYAAGGATQIYGTLIGGNASTMNGMPADDYPYSLFCDNNDNLFLLGTSTSTNYPTTSGCYDNSFASTAGFGLQNEDYVVTKLNSNGSALLASTYIGGTGKEGGSFQTAVSTIFIDATNNVLISGLTESSNYPVTAGVIQTALSGTSDGVVTKLNNNLSAVIWSSYIGGNGTDDVCDVKIAPNGNIYVCGNTNSSNFPGTTGSLNPSSFGNQDGFVSVINSTATSLIRSTYIGTSAKDKAKFIQVDGSNNVYVLGCTTNASYPVTTGAYNQPGTYNYFIHKLNTGLTSTLLSCCIGGNSNSNSNINEFVPTAFGIDSCNYMYFSGSNLNGGLPVTANALSSTSKSIYLASLDNAGTSLLFGSYYGGNVSNSTNTLTPGSHIHESTNNRFNPGGILFHTECYADNAYALANQVSVDNNSAHNAASFKLDFGFTTSSYTATTNPSSIVNPTCGNSNGTASVTITGGSGNFTYSWTPSGGSSNVLSNATAGTYTLTIKDQNPACGSGIQKLTVTLTNSSVIPVAATSSTICAGGSATLTASGASSYTWSPATGLSTTTGSAVVASPGSSTTYTVIGSTGTCTGSATASVSIASGLPISATSATTCAGGSATLTASGASNYTWSPATGLSTTTGSTVVSSPGSSGITYTVTGAGGGCTGTTTASVSISSGLTLTAASASLCNGSSVTLSVSGASSYTWIPATGLSNTNSATVTASPSTNTSYTINGNTGACTGSVVVQVSVTPIPTITVNSPTLCSGQTTTLTANGATSYSWSPATNLSASSGASVTCNANATASYTVTGSTSGCIGTSVSTVSVIASPTISVNSATVCAGSSATLQASGASSYTWNTGSNAATQVFSPATTTTYTVWGNSANGCIADSVATITVVDFPVITSSVVSPVKCSGEQSGSITIQSPNTSSYTWSPNVSSGNAASNLGAGIYSCSLTSGPGCNTSASFTITEPPKLDAIATSSNTTCNYCNGAATFSVSGGISPYSYQWAPKGSGNSAANLCAGNYTVTVSDSNGCAHAYTVNIGSSVAITVTASASDYEIRAGDETQLNSSQGVSYNWYPDTDLSCTACNNPKASPKEDIRYCVIVSDSIGCRDTACVDIQIECGQVYIPTAFSPNGDGINDVFCVYGNCIAAMQLRVFDRWGSLVFESEDVKTCWNGLYHGIAVNAGVFIYDFSCTMKNGQSLKKHGNVTVVN